MGLGLGEGLLQGGTTTKRCGAGTGPHPHPVLGDPIQIDQSLGQQYRDALGQQSVQQFAMIGAEVGQRVVIDTDITANPLIGTVAAAQFIELTCAADTVDGGVEPNRHEDLGINGGTPRIALNGLDPIVHGTEIQTIGVIPDHAGGMIRGNDFVERGGPEDDLVSVGGAQPRAAIKDRRLGGWRGPVFIGRLLEEPGLFQDATGGNRWVCSWRHCPMIFIICQYFVS